MPLRFFSNREVAMADIAHVVVLMLENRSFDSMLGRLYPGRADFDGLSGAEANTWNGQQIPVWSSPTMTSAAACIPTPDPNEGFDDMADQIFGVGLRPPSPATMDGFVANYMTTATNDPRAVMHGFTPDQAPVLSALAKSFGVSDRWHASAPNQTWPNRFFVHTGTAAGYLNNSPAHFPYLMTTIFNLLTQHQRSWRIYHHDIPQSATLANIWSELPDHLYSFEGQFMADAMAGNLPNYSFIEPRYFSDPVLHRMPNDQHPPHDIAFGERLIARCYDALRNGAAWKQTLFIVTYDEHGGIYDHVAPPAAVSPDASRQEGFAFDRYGVRVPAVLISPWIPPGSIVRPDKGSQYPFDHTSILSTLRNLFNLGGPLTKRDAVAPDLLGALSLPSPTNDGPPSLTLPTISPSDEELLAAHQSAPNDMQTALANLASNLPAGGANAQAHTANLSLVGARSAPRQFKTVEAALARAQAGLARFLSQPRANV
jgi:phospholipase C